MIDKNVNYICVDSPNEFFKILCDRSDQFLAYIKHRLDFFLDTTPDTTPPVVEVDNIVSVFFESETALIDFVGLCESKINRVTRHLPKNYSKIKDFTFPCRVFFCIKISGNYEYIAHDHMDRMFTNSYSRCDCYVMNYNSSVFDIGI
jgi:hypothetical protein